MNIPALKVDHVTKHFGGVKALTDMHLEFNKGEITGLMGSNGAGKSTLLNVIWGAFPPDSGQLWINGEEIKKITPNKAQDLGISIIFQHRRLMPYMTVAENIYIENMPKKNGIIDYKMMYADARQQLDRLDVKVAADALVADLTAEEKQLVEIVKACSRNPKILLMDEPTTALRQHEVQTLFGIMQNLKAEGCSVVFISHRLKEVMEICDRISIIRDGRNVIEGPTGEFPPDRLVELMTGTAKEGRTASEVASSEEHARHVQHEQVLMNVKNLKTETANGISFKLHRGEILGFAGLGGCGIEEVFGHLFGLKKRQKGVVELDGTPAKLNTPLQAVKQGIGFVPEDRQLSGEFLDLTVCDNICIPKAQQAPTFSTVNRKKELADTECFIRELSIKTESAQTLIKNLSGGNQQKAVIAKWLQVNSQVIVMNEPTAGIDVAAKGEVNRFIMKIAAEGKGILYTSSYLTELMEVSDRIIVMYQGRFFKEFSRENFMHNEIYLAMNGIDQDPAGNTK